MQSITANIGLSVNNIDGGVAQLQRTLLYVEYITADYVYDISTQNYNLDDGTPVVERTLILRINTDKSLAELALDFAFVSEMLGQDCIAWSTDNGTTGTLSGDKAQEYGAFNPAYFLPYQG